ncbi:Protein phosphatase 1 regulatory subunit 12A [Labeo rohita]|uniref:Protein phosphatase 1 regulatory subunit 12A n=1 Tax=Labeo rohita TaxID=84645 RepID=A0ABQ8LE47_LABRO|nr:Protein phosphatase 1 regulatory subunit 12A [Labeo rohita]
MAATDRSRSEAAKQRRQDQLQRWQGSETDRTGAEARSQSSAPGNRRARVRFAQGAVFMAACSAGDREEVAELLRQGADINHANVDGLTALHQACIDENADMVQFLVESGSDVNRGDNEGWTPLHAAASCGFIQIAKYLIEHGAHVGAVNSEGELPVDVATEDAMGRLLKGEIKKQGIDVDQARREEERVMLQDAMAVLAGSGSLGQTPLDVADENIVDNLEELQKKQNAMRSEKQKIQTPVIETSPPVSMAPARPRRTSISRMSSKEKITLHEREKHAPPTLQTPPTEEDEDESTRTAGQSKPSSSSSSEEESESESDAESEKAKTREMINNLNNKRNAASVASSVTNTALNQVKKAEPVRTSVTEAPGSWRTSLRKAGSSVTLGSAGASDPVSEALKDAETKLGMTRSASSPRLSSESDNKEPRLARVQPTPSRRLFSISDTSTNPDTSSSLLSRSSSYTRRLNSQSAGDVSAQNPSLPRSSSYGRKLDDPSVTSVTTATSGLSRLNNLVAQRSAQEEAEKKDPVSNSVTTTTTSGEPETKQRRKSYLTPVRDEEAEAQRKARSRHARQTCVERFCICAQLESRHLRVTVVFALQGVTLTDLQEAEKTMKTENKGKEKKKEEEEKEGKQKKGEEGEVSWRSRIANLQKSDLLGLTHPPGAPRPDRQDADSALAEIEERARERRRARARRRGKTGESDDNDPSGEEETSGGRDPQTDRYTSSRSDSVLNDCILTRGSESRDFRKLFEEMSRENRRLQSQLSDTQRTISLTRVELEKATQRQERFTDCTALLEMEKKEKKMLERRAAELEEELKVRACDHRRLFLIGSFIQFWVLIG